MLDLILLTCLCQVECPKYPGFCITRQKKEYPFIEIFHSPEQVGFILFTICLRFFKFIVICATLWIFLHEIMDLKPHATFILLTFKWQWVPPSKKYWPHDQAQQ